MKNFLEKLIHFGNIGSPLKIKKIEIIKNGNEIILDILHNEIKENFIFSEKQIEYDDNNKIFYFIDKGNNKFDL